MKMNLPNKLTLIRVLLVPVFVLFFILSINFNSNVLRILSLIVFVVASLTDMFDGIIARKYNLITNFGKLMDPLADKILVISALMLLTITYEINILWVLIVVIREISISAIRLVALEQNIVIQASKYGKYKTATQMIAVVLLLAMVHNVNPFCYFIVYLIFYISEFFVIFSFVDYIMKNKNVILSGDI